MDATINTANTAIFTFPTVAVCRAASFFFGVRKTLRTILGRFSIIYFRGLGLRIRVRVRVRVRVSVVLWLWSELWLGVWL